MPKDILEVKENLAGEDYIIGDVHGGAEQLKLVLAKLKENDRLFLVGDLADRGADSFEVYRLIMEHNHALKRAGLPQQIFVTRGNHEDMLLAFYKVKDNPEDPIYQAFMMNGGEWATKLDDATLKKIVGFIEELPYITHCPGAKPFNIVHADLPLSDAEIQARIKSGKHELTAEEKYYATWARPQGQGETSIKETGRSADEPITYCGHTIGGGVRRETNHINLDISTFNSHLAAMVAHHKAVCELVGDAKSQELVLGGGKSVKAIQGEVSVQLAVSHQKSLAKLVRPILDDKKLSAEEKAECIDILLTEIAGYHYRKKSRPLKDCQEIYLSSLRAITDLLDRDTASELAIHIGTNKLHILRFKDAANNESFTFFSQKEIRRADSGVHRAIGILGSEPIGILGPRMRG